MTSRSRIRISVAALLAVGSVLGAAAPAQAATVPGPEPASTTNGATIVRGMEYWLSDYGVRQAWATTRGEGVTIAVIDTGVDATHPDLRGAVLDGADFSGRGASNGQRPVGSDGADHGTLVASLAAGRGRPAPGADSDDRSAGVIGTAPAADILPISIGFGSGSLTSDEQIAEAVRFAVDSGADVINMSLTRNTLDWPESWDDAFLYAAEQNVVIVAAAGNRGSGTEEVGAPATMPGVLTVSGVDEDGVASTEASSQGVTIGVAAASEGLVGAIPGDAYAGWSGTSGATPIVSGIVALVKAAHPELDVANVINRVVSTARDAGASGPDYLYGFGLIDAARAVNDDVALVEANPMGDLAEWVRVHRRGDIQGAAPVAPTTAPEEMTAAEPPTRVLAGVFPTVTQLREVGLPLGVLLVFATLVVVTAVGTARQVGRRRKLE